MAQPNDALRLLEADLQALSLQASRVEGGVFGGLFSSGSGPLDPDVRDAAEDALTRLRAGDAVASDPERPLSENATTPALRAALLACASPRSDVALAGLRCAQRLVTPAMRADELCALADALGAEETQDEEVLNRESESDAVAVAKAQTLLRALELDACFDQKDASFRVAKRVTAACFTLLASANESARSRATNGGVLGGGPSEALAAQESGSKTRGSKPADARVVAAEAAAFRACERAFEEASRDRKDDGLKRAFAFGVFRDLCDAAKSDDARAARFALDALTRALDARPLSANAVYAFESVRGDDRGVEAIKTHLCAALVTKTFSDATVVSPGLGARSGGRRRDSADAVAEGRAATKCAVAFLRFAKPRRRDEKYVVERRSSVSASAFSASTSASAGKKRAPSPSAKSSFFAFLSPPRDAEDAEDEEDEDDARTTRESVEFPGKETETDLRSADAKVSDAFVDPFAAERTLFLGSFASSLEREMAPWRRSAALDALRTVAGDPELLRLARGGDADAFGDVTDILARVAEAGVSVRSDGDASDVAFSAALTMSGLTADTTRPQKNEARKEDAVPLRVAAAFRDASVAARGASPPAAFFFRDFEDSDETGHVAHAVFLALDGVLTLCSSLETLADESVFLKDNALKNDVCHMVERAWVSLESCLSTAFARIPGEAATLELCRALQALTRAAAAAGAEEAKDACLASLCAFSVSGNVLENNQTQKSAHAFRAMLNAAQSLVDADALGFRGWFAALETTRRVEARRVAAAKNVLVAVDEKRARTHHDATVIDALLASAAALLVSSAALSSDEQSADALEAARGSSARELDDAGRAFSSHPKRNGDGNVSAPNGTVRSSSNRPEPDLELRALSRFVDAVLLRVRGGAKARARAQAQAQAHERKGVDLRARGRAAWHTLEAHFRDALESARPSPEIARRACAQLERAVVGALESIANGSEDVSLDVAEVLAPLARAKARATCLPARLEAVEAMSALVRERGDLFTETAGWAAAFDALRAVHENGDGVQEDISGSENERRKKKNRRRSDDAAVVVAGWSAAAFVVSDVLPASLVENFDAEEELKTDGVRDGTDALALARVVPLLSSYARQTDDTRTSLSAVNALWNACDVIARRVETSGESSSSLETVLTRAFEALAAVGADPFRPDVRHSGLNTLVNVLAARGATLSPGAWRDATLGVFFPLVFEIRARAAAAGDERVDVSLVSSLTKKKTGRTRDRRDDFFDDDESKRDADADASDASSATTTDDLGSETTDDDAETTGRLLVHHSRNTAAKQWDETLSVAVSAIGKLVHKRGARLLAPETRDAFEPVWIRTCAFMVECITRASQETATAALRAARLAATRFASLSVEGQGSDKPPGGGDAKGRPEDGKIRSGDVSASSPFFPAPARIAASVRAAARTAHKAVLRDVYETSTRLATRDPDAKKRVTAKTRLELAKTLAEAFASAPRAAFDFDDVAVVVAVADALARAPEPWPEWFEDFQEYRNGPTRLKALKTLGSGYAALQTQRACFDALACLVPNVSDACVDAGTYVSVLFLFLSYVSGSDVSSGSDGSLVPKQPRSIARENAACVVLACDAFAKLVGDPKLPGDDLACAFADAVAAFKEAMAPRDDDVDDDDDDDDFERVAAATRAFHATLDRGVPAAQKYVSAAGGVDALRRSWGNVADAFEASVLGVASGRTKKKVGEKNEGASASSTTFLKRQRRRRERDALRREGLAALRDACARGDSCPEEIIARLVQVLTAGADAEITLDFDDGTADFDEKKKNETVARDAEDTFPSLCLARLRDLALSASSGPGASSAARLAAPALLDKCESSLRRHAAEESLFVRGPKQKPSDKDVYSFAVSAARASFAARALASALAPAIAPGAGSFPVGGFFFRKETPATILAAAATPERSRAVRAALEACAVSSDAALRDAAGKTLEAFSRFEETRA